ncbi:hypothetical protein BDM02DRAFT_3264640 [Thelephora ganbajun]|uniref:Uncharacterized protein n=1 Tax=Thelephora ganbajun TaxID=370292 RepID=A0ACB6YX69_THEGA|nr:hypothetical protein BDM02DRAFT_3264640 [Thelephora ganbajun]
MTKGILCPITRLPALKPPPNFCCAAATVLSAAVTRVRSLRFLFYPPFTQCRLDVVLAVGILAGLSGAGHSTDFAITYLVFDTAITILYLVRFPLQLLGPSRPSDLLEAVGQSIGSFDEGGFELFKDGSNPPGQYACLPPSYGPAILRKVSPKLSPNILPNIMATNATGLGSGTFTSRIAHPHDFHPRARRVSSLRNPLDCLSKNLLAISKARSIRYQKLPQTKTHLLPLRFSNAREQPQVHISSAPAQISPYRTIRDDRVEDRNTTSHDSSLRHLDESSVMATFGDCQQLGSRMFGLSGQPRSPSTTSNPPPTRQRVLSRCKNSLNCRASALRTLWPVHSPLNHTPVSLSILGGPGNADDDDDRGEKPRDHDLLVSPPR